jgi:hypothetical protein
LHRKTERIPTSGVEQGVHGRIRRLDGGAGLHHSGGPPSSRGSEVGNKKAYDPRSDLALAEKAAERVKQAVRELRAESTSIAG